ncbi:MAG: biopolymer transporter Tol, partial [Cyclobacteriaceae bacterium]|nr:biopolymer transporter Tol [Cyclobacteriaceae bacterium]
YTLNVRGQGRRLTNDVFDNITPVFLNDSTVIYASNFTEIADSLLTRAPDVKLLPDYFNIFKIDLNDSLPSQKLTNLNNKNFRPRVLNSNNILMISDQSGVNNLMRLTISNGIASQVSAYNRSVEAFDYASSINRIAYSYRDGNQSRIILESFSNIDQFTPSTPRVQLLQAKTLTERITTRRAEEDSQEKAVPAAQEALRDRRVVNRAEQRITTTTPEVKRDTTLNIRLEDVMLGIPPAQQQKPPTQPPATGQAQTDTLPKPRSLTGSISTDRLRFERRAGVDTDNYIFDTIPMPAQERTVATVGGRSNLLENFRRQSMQKRVTGPARMTPQFITNSLSTDWVVDPLRGFGVGLAGKMTDILDNHVFNGGI